MAYKFIQVIGTQRSGTNLLRVILNQFPEISAPHPPHILKNFDPYLHHYRDLENNDNFKVLIEDIIEWIRLNPVSWEIDLNLEDITKNCSKNTLLDVFRAVYLIKAKSEKAEIWCCKSTFNLNFYEQFELKGFDPFYIHLIRDGRDVALSFKNAPVGPKHIYHLAKNWKADQQKITEIKSVVTPDRFLTIKYEDLIHYPERVVKLISDRLNIPFSPEFLKYYNSEESKHTADAGEMWSNLTKPILKDNSKKYLQSLTNDELILFDRVAADVLEQYKYEPFNSNRDAFTSRELYEFDLENTRLIERVIQNSESPIVKKRNEQLAIFKKFNQMA